MADKGTYVFRCGCGASLSVPVHVRKVAMTSLDEARAEQHREDLIASWRADHVHCRGEKPRGKTPAEIDALTQKNYEEFGR